MSEGSRVPEIRDRQLKTAFENLMSTDWGRLIASYLIYDLGMIDAVNFFNQSGTGHTPTDVKDGISAALHLAFLEGRRGMAWDINNNLRVISPEGYDKMIQERLRRAAEDRGVLTKDSVPERV